MSNILKVVAKNKRAQFDYFIDESFEAGIVLTGSEVKSIRAGKISLVDSHAAEDKGELFLHNCHIDEYEKANQFNHPTRRPRKLLLKKKEIQKIIGKIKLKGYTLIAISMYFNKKNIVKVELGLSRGKKQHDKRQTIKENEWQRDQGRLMRDK
jgi:SsrA-binding protein